MYAHLHPPWSDLPYRPGDAVNLLAPLDLFEGHWHALLTMEQGLLVLHPDVLLSGAGGRGGGARGEGLGGSTQELRRSGSERGEASASRPARLTTRPLALSPHPPPPPRPAGTRITSANECPRRSFLDERVAERGTNDKAVKGTLTHNLIQGALTEGLRSAPQLRAAAERVVEAATESLLDAGLSEEDALGALRDAIPSIQTCAALPPGLCRALGCGGPGCGGCLVVGGWGRLGGQLLLQSALLLQLPSTNAPLCPLLPCPPPRPQLDDALPAGRARHLRGAGCGVGRRRARGAAPRGGARSAGH